MTDIVPDINVRNAMNEINASQRLRCCTQTLSYSCMCLVDLSMSGGVSGSRSLESHVIRPEESRHCAAFASGGQCRYR